MKTLALFNNKGGVGKTSLAYHLGFMFAELGHRVLFADLDPQANLSSLCATEDRLEAIWNLRPRPTIYGSIDRLRRGVGDIERLAPEPVTSKIVLVPGDLQLSEFEDDLSQQWPRCLDRDERAFRVTTALHRVVADVGERSGAEIAVLDVGPNFGAINRAALIAADYVLVPVAPDLFSMQGLENVGPRLKMWRTQWNDRMDRAPALDFGLPPGAMTSIGYVVARHSVLAGGAAKAFQRWIDRMPDAYRRAFDEPKVDDLDVDSDERCLGQLKDYRSLMPMAQEAKKPMFLLKPADGAIGGHQGAVRQAYKDFQHLAQKIVEAIGGL
ncbi:MAG TPA: AAA family ATPase [Kofleriaceae bacterium]|nr:AAA family ATPase [Kofleriaceae bacterium]